MKRNFEMLAIIATMFISVNSVSAIDLDKYKQFGAEEHCLVDTLAKTDKGYVFD